MLWVKGELLDAIESDALDPTEQLVFENQPVPFDRREWFERVQAHTPSGAPQIVRVASERALVWLFLAREGSSAKALSNWYTLAFRPIFSSQPDDARKAAMLVAAAKRLKSARPALSQITLAPVPSADGTAALLMRSFNRGGWIAVADQSSTSWTANVAGKSFADYWAERPGQLRSTFKRKRSKAEFEVQIFDRFDQAAWADYESVYSDSWKAEEGSPAFLRDWAMAEAKRGQLRLGICRIDDFVVAAQFWTVDHGIAYIHKLAHREQVKDLSPGTILSEALFRHVIDIDKVKIIDFGTGNDAYKADWMDGSTPLMTVTAFNLMTMHGAIGAARAQISRLVRRVRAH
jgi:CelD/BcsL family acetyltransferase involved in cellulose biosynthesis